MPSPWRAQEVAPAHRGCGNRSWGPPGRGGQGAAAGGGCPCGLSRGEVTTPGLGLLGGVSLLWHPSSFGRMRKGKVQGGGGTDISGLRETLPHAAFVQHIKQTQQGSSTWDSHLWVLVAVNSPKINGAE